MLNAAAMLILILFQDAASSDFDDLGRMLLGGFLAAIILAIGIVVIKRRTEDKNPPSQFISIATTSGDEETIEPSTHGARSNP